MYKAIKIRLYPNKTQTEQFNKLLGCYRFVYNKCLEKKINSYKKDNFSETLTSLGRYFHHELINQEKHSWLKEENTKVLKQSIIDMLSAYKHFFKEHKGFPKFKSKHDIKLSCRFINEAISKKNDYSTHKLSLANIKNIPFRCSVKYVQYLITYKNSIRSATLSKSCSGNFFLSILIDMDTDLRLPLLKNSIGLDLGIKNFVITSKGSFFNNFNFKKSKLDKLKKLQKKLSKKKKGSCNRTKVRIKLAKLNEYITNSKHNYLHNISAQLINENQVICIEDLNVKGMMKNHRLAEAIQELNFGEFRKILEYKCKWYGRELVIIDRFFPSSKKCNHCGHINKQLKLNDREWECPQCGEIISRDYNAALNILEEGIRIIGSRTTEFKPLENPTMDDKEFTPLKSSDFMKKEIKTIEK